jgi:NitT/TauT family transport system permease protein
LATTVAETIDGEHGEAHKEELLSALTLPNPWLARYDRYLYGVIGLAVVIFAWWLFVTLGFIDGQYLSPPQDVVKAFFGGFADGSLSSQIWPSLQRALIGFVIALVTGIGLGIVVGSFKNFGKFAEPILLFFRNLSLLALFPVFVLFLGIGEQSKIAIVAWAAFWPIFLNAVSAVAGVEKILVNAAFTLGAGRRYIFTRVVLPAAIPGIFPGIKLAATVSFTALVAAELLGGTAGLGIYIQNAELHYDTPHMYAGILTLGFIGIILNLITSAGERYLTQWQIGLTSR